MDAARVRDLVAGKFRVQYTIAGIWYCCNAAAGPARSARRAIERDDGAVEVWKKETWPRIEAPRRPRRLDRLRSRVRPVGEAAAVADLGAARDHSGHPGPRRRQRAHLGGRAGLLPARRPGRLIYRLRLYRGRKGETKAFTWTEYRDLLLATHRQLPGGNIVLIWDNLNVHLKAELRAFTDTQAWLRVSRLPHTRLT